MAPDAGLDRRLVLVTFRSLQLGMLLRTAAGAMGGRDIARRHPKVDYRADVAEAVVTGYGPFPYQVDGEPLGDAERLELRWAPQVL